MRPALKPSFLDPHTASMVGALTSDLRRETMSINVNTENVTDATVQVHISFENASRRARHQSKGPRKPRNNASLRSHKAKRLSTGRNRAQHQSSARKRRYQKQSALGHQKPKALPAPKPKSPA